MKKLFVTMIALAAAVTAFAQMPEGLAVGAGYLSSDSKTKMGDVTHTETYGGFFVNADYNIHLSDALGVAPGVALDFLSKKENDVNYSFINLDIPVMVNYTFPVGDILKVIPFAGPTVQLGLSGKAKAGDNTVNLYGKDHETSRLQLYVGGGVALEIAEILRVHIGYDLGLLNRYTGDADYSAKNNGLHFGVSYLF